MSAAEAGAASRCALYLRCSTDKQHTDVQRPAVEQLARARGFAVAYVFEETVSAIAARRPAWERLQRGAHLGDFQAVVLFALDRLGRSMSATSKTSSPSITSAFRSSASASPGSTPAGPVRNLLVAIFSWVAEQERTRLVERTKAGLQAARRRGAKIGRPRRRVDLDRARELRVAGQSLRAVAKELGIGYATLCRALAGETDKAAE